MIVILFRVLVIIALVLLVYTLIQYYRNPSRRLRLAKVANEFFFLDEPNNSKKNVQFVYKGCLFEGEKYLGTTEDAFEVVNIHVTVRDPLELRGLTRDDLYFMEKEILMRYPYASIEWKHPINQLLLTSIE
ncbi:sigma-w pathway protein ysdB [Oceanobacillus sp. M65]|uniref:Sigma-w pathway protein ysdB n=1 Tax=Oceanobacillus jordanicus TaxID=2867266 RepID=A0AAW5B648_9BACI|nr:sigma-w pathway protein ysdB [Oceanobacillus jordanicus]AVQ99585.1 sigma-w pathway protein ysdB [Oceanobacillus iheyensis]MCG3420128.1 sigma-w pathway protein ysdB [Oceanobacillus jordanicus]